MTEKEALRRLEIHKSWGLSNRLNEAMCLATQALKEIQQYRELGTVEECREAVEKQKAKKPMQNQNPYLNELLCPNCGKVVGCFVEGMAQPEQIEYCTECGQHIEEINKIGVYKNEQRNTF